MAGECSLRIGMVARGPRGGVLRLEYRDGAMARVRVINGRRQCTMVWAEAFFVEWLAKSTPLPDDYAPPPWDGTDGRRARKGKRWP